MRWVRTGKSGMAGWILRRHLIFLGILGNDCVCVCRSPIEGCCTPHHHLYQSFSIIKSNHRLTFRHTEKIIIKAIICCWEYFAPDWYNGSERDEQVLIATHTPRRGKRFVFFSVDARKYKNLSHPRHESRIKSKVCLWTNFESQVPIFHLKPNEDQVSKKRKDKSICVNQTRDGPHLRQSDLALSTRARSRRRDSLSEIPQHLPHQWNNFRPSHASSPSEASLWPWVLWVWDSCMPFESTLISPLWLWSRMRIVKHLQLNSSTIYRMAFAMIHPFKSISIHLPQMRPFLLQR